MNKEIYDIYKRNFPDNIRNVEIEKLILFNKDNHFIIKRNSNGDLCGISIINGNTVLLLCVDSEYGNRGIGSYLLDESEDYIMNNGYNKMNIGEGFDYLTPGVPINDINLSFFKKRGYYHSWGNDECFDMDVNLNDVNYDMLINDKINGILYRMATISDLEEIKKCVSDAEPKFVEFYMNPTLYSNNDAEMVLIAIKDKEVCGTLIILFEKEAQNMGSVGCTTTKNKYRHQGIATNMVKIGTRFLKDNGLEYGHLGYTYTGLDKMYGEAGYHISKRYMMAEKSLKKVNIK